MKKAPTASVEGCGQKALFLMNTKALTITLVTVLGSLVTTSASAYDRYDRGSSHHNHNHYQARPVYSRTVAWAQSIMQNLGYYHGCVDGIMGPMTRRAIVSYQCDHGLRHTGSLDSATLCAMREE
jgi:Putative peptidoglycan binding domain